MKIKKIVAFLLVLMLTIMPAGIVKAESKESDLYYNDKEQNILISVVYEKNDVTISFIDPSGNELDLTSEGVMYSSTDTSMLVVIENAAAGQWKIKYDKGSNESIKYMVQPYESTMWISSMTLGEIVSNSMPVNFVVTKEDNVEYTYKLLLGTDESLAISKEIASGSGFTNMEIIQSLDMSAINSYDGYYLGLEVSYSNGGVEYFDKVVSGPFKFENTNTIEGVKDYSVTVNESTQSILVNLTDVPGGTEGAFIVVKEDGKEIASEYITEFDKSVEAIYTDPTKEIECAVSIRNSNGLISAQTVKKFTVSGGNKFDLVLPETGIQNNDRYEYSYSNANNQLVNVTINSNKPQELKLDGTGKGYLVLDDMQNKIVVEYINEDGIKFKATQTISIDDVPPTLAIYEDLDGTFTKETSVIIAGKTDPNAKLTVNNAEVATNENGVFDYKVELKDGENVIKVDANDNAGNITSYVIKIKKGKTVAIGNGEKETKFINKLMEFLPLIIALFLSIFGIAIMIVASMAKKKSWSKKAMLKKEAVVVMIFSIISAIASGVGYFVRRAFEKSKDFIELSLSDPKDAYDYISTTKVTFTVFVISIVLVVLIGGVLGIKALLAKKKVAAPNVQPVTKEEETSVAKSKDTEVAEPDKSAETTEQIEEVESETVEEKVSKESTEAKGGTKNCKHCGNSISDTAKFCSVCGKEQ